jgi:hypothetical protein
LLGAILQKLYTILFFLYVFLPWLMLTNPSEWSFLGLRSGLERLYILF